MYAVIRTGGKQYRVEPGVTIRVEKLDKEIGTEFDLSEVLLIGGDKIHVGTPLVEKAKVTVVVTRQAKGPKVLIYKKKRRKGYEKLTGHRQLYTELFVAGISGPDGQHIKAEAKPVIVDPVKKAERLAKAENKPKKKKVAKKVAAAPKKKKVAKKATSKAGAKKKTKKKASKK
ncbi:MAG: 50S ribosomal protein L21 [Bdellovibrionales bacterium CG10_big_fil_rev_8_21_14_0_10_45_34]|nr:MAG: 50S ribosomal protein L21 [Bdellovibrionales bacterium CG10_big_fil_rev_8_21_14_0_10_45_34]